MALNEVGSLQAEAEAEGGRVEAGGRLGGRGDHQVGAVHLEKGGFLVMFFCSGKPAGPHHLVVDVPLELGRGRGVGRCAVDEEPLPHAVAPPVVAVAADDGAGESV